ncbi:MAG: aspartate--tRNA(Asn) ligase [Candidatus Asgardarchaeia archaeon]
MSKRSRKKKLMEICSRILWKRTHFCGELGPELDGKDVVLYGWVHRLRRMGGLNFLLLRDRSGIVQVIFSKKNSPEDVLKIIKEVSLESALAVRGRVKANDEAPNGFEVIPKEVVVVNKSEGPLPLDVTETIPAEMDTRFDNRPIDLRKRRITSIFIVESVISNALREYFYKNGFVEIHTPKIVAGATEGGANVFKVEYFKNEVYLAQSPQLYKQLALVGGLDRVFEIAPAYRAEEHNTPRHLNEYISVDAEIAWIKDEEGPMEVLENAVSYAVEKVREEARRELEVLGLDVPRLKTPFLRLTYKKALDLLEDYGKEIEFGEDIDSEGERMLGEIVRDRYKREIYFIKEYPEKIRPFYTMPCPDDPELTRSFDLEFRGLEITTGGQRIHDYELLIERIKEKGLNPDNFEFYTKFFKYGVPPHGGFGLGLERFVMKLLDLKNIREASLFPRTTNRVIP